MILCYNLIFQTEKYETTFLYNTKMHADKTECFKQPNPRFDEVFGSED